MSEEQRKQVAAVFISFVLTVAIPSLVFGMIKVDPSWGWPLVGICILLSATALIWGFSKHHLTDWRAKMLPLILMVVGFSIYLIGAYWYFASHSSQPDSNEYSPLAAESLPGFSATGALSIHDLAASRRKYVFDFHTPEGARASFYFSAKDYPIFAITDLQGETYSIDAPLGNEGIPLNKVVYLTCEVGVTNNATYLRILVDGREVAHQELHMAIDLGSKSWAGTLGTDKDRQNTGAFSAGLFGNGHVTMPDDHLKSHIENARKLMAALGFNPDSEGAQTSPVAVGGAPPKLLDLYVNDFQPQLGLTWHGYAEFTLTTNGKSQSLPIFYKIVDDVNANAKFVSFYVPTIYIKGTEPSSQSVSIIGTIADHLQSYINDIGTNHWAVIKSAGVSDSTSTKDIPFSGRVYIYHADDLSTSQKADLQKMFAAHGAKAQFLGMDYALAAWSEIRLGNTKPPPEYEVHGNQLQLVPGQKIQP